MTDDKKIGIFYDHYKDTFENQKTFLKKRDYYTLICIGLIAILSFQISNPYQSSSISNEIIKKNVGDIKIDFWYINNILTFALLWVVILYYQINLHIERMYKYLREIEKKITIELKPFELSREGDTYLEDYPWLSKLVHKFFSVGFPLMFIIVAVLKWVKEKDILTAPWTNGHFWINSIFLLGIISTSLLYLSNRHFNDFKKVKKK